MTAGYAAVAFILLVGLAVVLDWALASSLERQVGEAAKDEAEEVAVVLREAPGSMRELQEELRRSKDADPGMWVRVLEASGRLVIETQGMEEAGLSGSHFLPASLDPGIWQAGRRDVLPSGMGVRTFSTYGSGDQSRHGARIIQIAIDSSDEDALLATYRYRLGLALAGAFGALSLVGYLIARVGMRPVRRIVETMITVRAMPLPQRVDTRGLPAELRGLAVAFNDVLERLDQSFLRLAQFSADIAHELRTPLNRLALQTEVTLQKPRSEAEYRDVLASCLDDALKLSRLIERLLFLARSDESLLTGNTENLDISKEMATLVEFYATPAGESGIALRTDAPPGVRAVIDRELLQSVLGNLVENAMAYTPAGGAIILDATEKADEVRLSVADTGCGIPADEVPHLFDALHRVDRARSTASGGAGLGLAIVNKIAHLYGGDVIVETTTGAGTTVTVTLAK